MKKRKAFNLTRLRRKKRTRAKIFGTALRPRLSVFRSNKDTYVQLIDDSDRKTLLSASTREIRKAGSKMKEGKNRKVDLSSLVGRSIAKKAMEVGIKQAVFDRGDKKYHGRVKAVAEEARAGGLKI